MGANKLKQSAQLAILIVLCLLLIEGKCWCYDTQVAQFSGVAQIDFSFDNRTFLSVDSTNSLINIYRIDTKALIFSYLAPNQPRTAKFSKDGKNIGIGMQNGNIQIINATNYAVVSTITNPLGAAVVELDFSWNSDSLLACSTTRLMFMSFSGTVSWTVTNGTLTNIYSCKLNKADDMGFSFNDQIAWYQYNTNTILASDRFASSFYYDVDFSMESTGMRLMAGNSNTYVYWYTAGMTGNMVGTRLIRAYNWAVATCQSKDNNYVATGDRGGRIHIAYTAARADITTSIFNEAITQIDHCRFSYDSKTLAVASATNGIIYFFTTQCFTNKCRQGFYDNNGVCATCSVMPSCLTCSNSTICTACIQGFYLSGSSCVTCASAGCQSCESSSKCLECSQGYYLDYSTYTCKLCSIIPGCIACRRSPTLSTVLCRQCSVEYYLNATGSFCIPCTANNTKCKRCFNSSACLECQIGYYIDNQLQCQICTGNCLVCTNSSFCLTCRKGYYSNSSTGNACVACGINCLDCYNNGSCSNCAIGTYLSAGSCSNCVPPCTSCNSSSSCNVCQAGFFLNSSNICSLCFQIYPNCATCNIYSCLTCQIGYYPTTTGCQACTSLTGCSACFSSTACTQCFIGYYLSGGSCLTCSSQCQDCTDSTTCSGCSLGFYISGTSCLACPSPCVTCTSSTNCSACQTGYFINTTSPSTCTKCSLAMIGCLSCNSSSFCNECELGRYANAGGSCSICPVYCSTCNQTACLFCSIGFYMASGYCQKCHQNCSECNSLANCSSCNVGYFLVSSSNSCVLCNFSDCATCNANGCLSCQIGYLLSATKTCINCSTKFANCQLCSELACTQCLNGFYTNSGICSLCSSTAMGCAVCYNNTSCGQCEPGYYLQPNSTCAFCPLKCRTCNPSAICTSCQLQYTFNTAQNDCLLCESFIDGCQYCASRTVCQTCFQGFYLSSSTSCSFCKTSLIGCISCFNSSVCSVCEDDYYLLNGTCVTCQAIPSCNYCLNSSVCLSCKGGYYINNNNTCSLCTTSLPGCIFCASSSTCRQCQAGYFLSTTNQCQQCLNNMVGCLFCLNATKCIECDGGYYLSTSTFRCVGCEVAGCQVCLGTSSNVCQSCSKGYYLSSNTCSTCPQIGCLDCSSAAVCIECHPGYFLSGSSCIRCKNTITACSKCINSTVCQQCDSTFYLNSSKQCSPCILTLPSCASCFNSSYCTTCSTGYYSQSGVCTSCFTITGCFMCLSSSACQNCVKGYYLSSNICVSCSNSLPNCFECTNSSICLSCTSGYLLDAGNICQLVVAGGTSSSTSVASESDQDQISQLVVKTFYVSSQALKFVLYAKQGYSFTKQNITWNSVTSIALYNSAKMSRITLAINSVQWGAGSTSIIFYTNNPLTINASAFDMPMTRLLVTAEGFSLSYQTKFSLSQAALSLLMPNVIFSNDFTQETPLMKPSFYTSYLQNSGQYYFTIIGYVIVAILFANLLIKVSCSYPNSKYLGELVPHVLALKTCALVLYPIYPQVANFCYGLMAADIPWLAPYYADYLAISSDVSPAGFQLFYLNMNFASLYLAAFVLCIVLLFLGCIYRSKRSIDSVQFRQGNNRQSSPFIHMVYLFFSFGLTFAGSASIQGSLYNPIDFYSLNGFLYMIGGGIYCIQLGVVVFASGHRKICYLRSFLKASLLSIAHISPIYICTLAVTVDISLLLYQFYKCKQSFNFTKAWLGKNILVNFCLLCLFYYNEKKIVLLIVLISLVVALVMQLMQHLYGISEQPRSNRIKPSSQSQHKRTNEINETIAYFVDDHKEYVSNEVNGFTAKQKQRLEDSPEKRTKSFKGPRGRNSLVITQSLQDNIDQTIDIQ